MKIESVEDSVFVSVSKKDMDEMSVTYEEFANSCEKSKNVIDEVLMRVNEMTGKSITRFDRLQIKVLPDYEGGCLMIFSYSENSCHFYDEKGRIILETDNINNIIDLSRALYLNNCSFPKIELYEKDGLFRLVTKAKDKLLLFLSSEYLDMAENEPYIYEKTAENFNYLGDNGILEIFSGKTS